MIPRKLLKTAEAEYFCNVTEFICMGEGRLLTPREICGIKMCYPAVQDWIKQLNPKRRMQVLDYIRREYERSRRRLVATLHKWE